MVEMQAGKLAEKIDTDSRNIALHLSTAAHLGVSIEAWINALKEMPRLSEAAKMLGISETYLRSEFTRWLRKNNLKKDYYIYYEESIVHNIRVKHPIRTHHRVLKIPPEFIQHMEKTLAMRTSKYTIKELAEELGIRRSQVSARFRHWCGVNGVEPTDFATDGIIYSLPVGFVSYMKRVYGDKDEQGG